jgi:hypothetical protein
MVHIKTAFFPYRMVLMRKEPVQLTIGIRNDQKEARAYSIELEVGRSLSIGNAGAKMNDFKHLGTLSPGQEKTIYYDIFAKAHAGEESIPVDVRIHEHPKDSKGVHDIIQTFSRKMDLAVQNR